MAYITKRGNSYSVRYTYEDEHGKSYDKWESFPTKEEATNRKKQIEHELAAGTFLIPSSVTVAEFLMDWLPKQCSKHKWAPKTYESNLSTIQNLIIPYIGSMEMQKLKPYHMENLYTTLSKTPCGSYIEGKKQELTEKQKQRFLSGTTIHEVHRLLGTAFQYAVEWGILVKSPVPVDSPKKSTQERTIWTVEEMRAALDSMEDPILHLAVHLTLVAGQLADVDDDIAVVEVHVCLAVEAGCRTVYKAVQNIGDTPRFRGSGQNSVQVAQYRHFTVLTGMCRVVQTGIIISDALIAVGCDDGFIQ